MTSSIGVLLTSFMRPQNLARQLAAIRAQTVQPEDLIIWHNHGGVDPPADVLRSTKCIAANFNSGVWPRFSACRTLFNTEFVAVYDDDTIPGKLWLEHCLASHDEREALIGAVGVTFPEGTRNPRVFSGPHGTNGCDVDIVGHCWFFRRSLLEHYPDCHWLHRTAGEDYAMSLAAQRAGIPVVVPLQPAGLEDCWGTTEQNLGADSVALWRTAGEEEKKHDAHNAMLAMGWQPLCTRLGVGVST